MASRQDRDELVSLMTELDYITYKPGWKFYVENIRGRLNLVISTTTHDSYNPENADYHTAHYFELPYGAPPIEEYDPWVFECIMKVEKHEAMEFFQLRGKRIYAPVHSRSRGTYYLLPDELPTPTELH